MFGAISVIITSLIIIISIIIAIIIMPSLSLLDSSCLVGLRTLGSELLAYTECPMISKMQQIFATNLTKEYAHEVSYGHEIPKSMLIELCCDPNDSESRSVVSDSLRHHGLYGPWNSPGQNTGVDSHSLLQGIFPTQGLNPGIPHCRQILYCLSHKGGPLLNALKNKFYLKLHPFQCPFLLHFFFFSFFPHCTCDFLRQYEIYILF